MIANLLIGGLTMVVCLVIQCVAVDVLFRGLLALESRRLLRPTLAGTTAVLTMVMLVLLIGTMLQIVVWSALFVGCGEFEDFGTAFYHSVVNFATLGYGDLVMSEERRLLGGLEALNGVLMIGLVTGVLFTVLNALLYRAWGLHVRAPGDTSP